MRISATLIDQWIRYKSDEDYPTEAQLIESIQGVFRPSRQMDLGSSFDQIMQEPSRYRTEDGYLCHGIAWPVDMIEEQAALFTEPGLWQAKEVLPVQVNGEVINVVSKVDRLVADGIEELKTRWGAFDYEKYYRAHQWRWYLLTFGAAWIRYTVFCMYEPAKGPIKLNSVERFTLYPYAGMEQDCLDALRGLVEFIHLRKLESFVADDHPRLMREVA